MLREDTRAGTSPFRAIGHGADALQVEARVQIVTLKENAKGRHLCPPRCCATWRHPLFEQVVAPRRPALIGWDAAISLFILFMSDNDAFA